MYERRLKQYGVGNQSRRRIDSPEADAVGVRSHLHYIPAILVNAAFEITAQPSGKVGRKRATMHTFSAEMEMPVRNRSHQVEHRSINTATNARSVVPFALILS